MKPDISIVIPAYNESERLGPFLSRVISYCKNSAKRYEIIVVDDGSSDNTVEIAESYKSRFPHLYTIRIQRNRGKGYAVKTGLLKATGTLCVFLDADGSVDPREIEKNAPSIFEDGYDIFIGSRVLKAPDQVLKVRWYRKAIGTIFNFCVHTFLFQEIKDTQCGFKMFRREIITPLFSRSYIQGFGFDIEILYLAYKMGYKVKEGPVSWRHVRNSKVNLFTDSIKMFWNILQTRNWHCTPINPFSQYLGPNEYRYMYDMENYHWWFVSRRNLVVHLIKTLTLSSPTILDVGSGTGGNLAALGRFGETFGIDVSRQAIEFCTKRGLKNVIRCPVEQIEYNNEMFDLIACLDVLEHVPRPVAALREIKRTLKDDGKVLITVPAFRILWSQHDEALSHLRRYEKDSLIRDIHEAGLKIDTIGYFFFSSFFAVAPIRIARLFLAPKKKPRSDTTTLPPRFLNEFLKLLFTIEIIIADTFGLPFGTTLYAVISKPDQRA